MWVRRLLLRCILTFSYLAAAEPQVGVPLQIVQPGSNHTTLNVVVESLELLSKVEKPIALLSVVGPYHSGKSFLLNSISGDMKTFQVGPQTTPETMGIWICRTNMTTTDGKAEIWLVDSEGFFGPKVAEEYDAKIFTIATLISSHLVYNSVKVIDQQATNLIEMLARRAQLYRTRSTMENGVEPIGPNFLREAHFPPLTWVVEDFVQEIPQEYTEGGATQWLTSYLSTPDNATQPYIVRLFKDLTVKTLFLPATNKKALRDLSKLEFHELTADFRDEVKDLRRHLLSNSVPKPFDDQPMTGKTLAQALSFLVRGLETNLFPELPSMWLSWSEQVAERSLQDAISWFGTLTKRIQFSSVRIFVGEIKSAEERAEEFYIKLLEDFDTSKNIDGLKLAIIEIKDEVMKTFQSKARIHFQNLINDAEEQFNKETEKIEFPMEPPKLKIVLEKGKDKYIDNLSKKWDVFRALPDEEANVTVSTGFWEGAAPTLLLRNHLETSVHAKIGDNDRSIQVLFQNAMQTVLSSCEFELSAHRQRLFGRKAMQDFANKQLTSATQLFEANLEAYEWVKFHDQFKLHRSHIQTEAQEKIRRFELENHGSLNAYFNQVFEEAWEHYKVKKNSLRLPLDDQELETAQEELRLESLQLIPTIVKDADVSDTQQHTDCGIKLEKNMKKEYQRLANKNVELWRVHSDEATNCAQERLKVEEKQCTLMGNCLFHFVPYLHRDICSRFLYDCLQKHQTSRLISSAMQQKIFESWYEKDLQYDATYTKNNFWAVFIGFGGLLFTVMSMSVYRSRGNNHRMSYTNISQSRYDTPSINQNSPLNSPFHSTEPILQKTNTVGSYIMGMGQ